MKLSDLTEVEQHALQSLNKYGPAEDCRSGLDECAAYELLAIKGLVKRRQDETWITEAGKLLLEG